MNAFIATQQYAILYLFCRYILSHNRYSLLSFLFLFIFFLFAFSFYPVEQFCGLARLFQFYKRLYFNEEKQVPMTRHRETERKKNSKNNKSKTNEVPMVLKYAQSIYV